MVTPREMDFKGFREDEGLCKTFCLIKMVKWRIYTLRKIYPKVVSKGNVVGSWVKSLSLKKSLNCVKFLAYWPMLCKISELDI